MKIPINNIYYIPFTSGTSFDFDIAPATSSFVCIITKIVH